MEAPAVGTPAGEERAPPARRATGVGYVLLWAALAAVVAALVGLGPLKPLVSYIAYLDDGGAMTSTEEPETAPRPADVTLGPPKAEAVEAGAPELEPELEPEPEAPGTAGTRAADGGQDLAIGLSEAARAFIAQHDWAKPMRVPQYCFTGVRGEVVVPHVEKAPTFTPPSREAGDLILKIVSTDLPCLVLRPECELTPAPVGDYRDTLPESRRPGRFHEHLFDRKMLGKPAAERMKRLPNLKPGALGTCAMVGNADSLLKAAAGPTIDAHDFVMRFNVLTRGWEKHVGRRVDGLFHKAEYNQPKNKKRPYKTKYNGVQVPKRLWMFPQYRHPRENLVRKGKKMVLFGSDYHIWQKFAHEIYKAGGAGEGGKRYKPMGGLMRFMALAELTRQGVCTRLDVYGLSGLGGGKYFRPFWRVHAQHKPTIDHWIRKYIMAGGFKGKYRD